VANGSREEWRRRADGFRRYNALWSLWYPGAPETVFAHVNHLRHNLVLSYKNGVGLFESSWDLPRGFQDLEVFELGGSHYMRSGSVQVSKDRGAPVDLALAPLPRERAEPIAYMVRVLHSSEKGPGPLAHRSEHPVDLLREHLW
jgi:hypothetical protein